MVLITKFLIKPDALNLMLDLSTEGVEYMYKIEAWNYDSPETVVEIPLDDTEPYNDGIDTYEVTQVCKKTIALSSLPLAATMIVGRVYTLHTNISPIVPVTQDMACSNVRDVFYYLADKLVTMGTSLKTTRYLPMSLYNTINTMQNSLFAHTESLRLGLMDDAAFFYGILAELYTNRR
jgi:hypothetical protein